MLLGDAPPAVRNLPSSAKLVYLALRDGEKTKQQLVKEAAVSGNTVWRSLNLLEDIDVIRSRPSPTAPKKTLYSLSVDDKI